MGLCVVVAGAAEGVLSRPAVPASLHALVRRCRLHSVLRIKVVQNHVKFLNLCFFFCFYKRKQMAKSLLKKGKSLRNISDPNIFLFSLKYANLCTLKN